MESLRDTFAVGIGTLKLRLVSRDAAIGETLRGRVELTLPRVVEADRLTVSVFAMQRVVGVDYLRKSATLSTRKLPVVRRDLELSGDAIYSSGGHDFALVVPKVQWGAPVPIPDALAQVVGVVSAITTPVRFPLEWFVEARLHRTWKIDLKERIGIHVEGDD